MDNLNNKSLLKICRNDFFEKISKSEIFTTNSFGQKYLETLNYLFKWKVMKKN